jgi:hypothetical protein
VNRPELAPKTPPLEGEVFMRSFILMMMALSFGAIGCQKKETPTDGTDGEVKPAVPKRPRLVVADGGRDLGEADFGQTRSATVRVSNTGGEPLRLGLASKSCSCGDVVLPEGDIPPGGEGVVTIRWTPAPGKIGPYRLAVELTSNDPDVPRPRLEFTGRIAPLVRMLPEDRASLDFLTVPVGSEVEREVRLVSSRLTAFDVEVKTTLTGLKTTLTKLPPDPDGEGFTSGYLLKVRTTPELPAGAFRDLLTLNMKAHDGKSWSIELPVYGEVPIGAFEVQPHEVRFTKKSLAEADARTMRVQFFVPSDDEALRVERCQPNFLKVDGPRRLKPGQWEFTVNLPAGNAEALKRQADGYLEGTIVLTTPRSPRPVHVPVKWVAGKD